MKTINQIIAEEKIIKADNNSHNTKLNVLSENPNKFTGFTKKYRPLFEEGEQFPADSKRVQHTTNNIIQDVAKSLTKLFDITLTKDSANCLAKADIEIDGVILAKDCPPTNLIFIEKTLHEIKTIINGLQELDDEFNWTYNTKKEIYESDLVTTHKTKKIQKPLVLISPTKEHAGQAEILSVDETIGYWDMIKLSGGITPARKKQILERIQQLIIAVRCAKEKANMAKAEDKKIGDKIFEYILKD